MFNIPVLLGGLGILALQALVSVIEGSFTPSQMRKRFPTGSILPFVYHGGMWADIPLTFLLSYLTGLNGDQWTFRSWLVALFIGAIFSFSLHKYVFAPGSVSVPEAHVQRGKITNVGWLHAIYFTIALAILILTDFGTRAPGNVLWYIACYMTVHIFLGSHLILEWIAPKDFRDHPSEKAYTWIAIFGTFIGFGLVALVRT